MIRLLTVLVLAAAASAAWPAAPAQAHPHVFITMKSEIVYGPDGKVTAVRHAWTFDDLFSTYALQDIQSAQKGVYSREELAPLAEVNVGSLKEYDYFTQASADGGKLEFDAAKDYWLEYRNETLTLHFTLPLKTPAKARSFELEIYDPVYFIDFAFEEKDPVRLSQAPSGCKLNLGKPGEASMAMAKRLGESFFSQPDSANIGAQFANKIAVACP